MKIILKKDNLLNSIKAVKGVVGSKGAYPILSAILIETIAMDKIKVSATDLNLSIVYTTSADVQKEGKIAVNAKVMEEVITKLPDNKDILIELNEETNVLIIKSEKTKYEIITLNSNDYPNIPYDETKVSADEKEFEILSKDLNKAIKQTAFSAVQNEVSGVLTGVCFTINENILETVATDGNRLTRSRIPINSRGENITFICTGKTLSEVSRLISLADDKMVKFSILGNKILFKFENIIFHSGLIEGTYPRYQQLIPTTNEKIAIIDREKLINTIDRVSVMVNNRTNIMKFNFEDSLLEISTDTPEAGSAKESIDINYTSENLLIAFNYKYVLDVLRNIQNEKIGIEMSTNLSATVIKPEDSEEAEAGDSYLCLIMPVQVR